ncbi:ribose/Galactose Isomerase family protein, partial [Vibrio parahaemolyticus V-223/04]
WLASLTL